MYGDRVNLTVETKLKKLENQIEPNQQIRKPKHYRFGIAEQVKYY